MPIIHITLLFDFVQKNFMYNTNRSFTNFDLGHFWKPYLATENELIYIRYE